VESTVVDSTSSGTAARSAPFAGVKVFSAEELRAREKAIIRERKRIRDLVGGLVSWGFSRSEADYMIREAVAALLEEAIPADGGSMGDQRVGGALPRNVSDPLATTVLSDEAIVIRALRS
jgi:hypothetical protein